MNNLYTETIALCPECAKDSPAYYEERQEGMFLNVQCDEHGSSEEQVESDSEFFKQGYELEYEKPYNHLILPITYRCNLKCRHCYTLSNSSLSLPEDRTLEKLTELIKNFAGSINLVGGEPTLRSDLMQVIRAAKEINNNRAISLSTNGQRLRDINLVKELKESGLDYVYLSLNDIEYDGSEIYQNKLEALNNCYKLSMPVWLHRIIDDLAQLDSLLDLLETYKRVIFSVSVMEVKPFGTCYPSNRIFVSSILRYLKKENDYTKGTTPFNRYIRLKGRKVKVNSWVNDTKRLDPIDSNYIMSNDTLTTFFRGATMDEVLLKGKGSQFSNNLAGSISC